MVTSANLLRIQRFTANLLQEPTCEQNLIDLRIHTIYMYIVLYILANVTDLICTWIYEACSCISVTLSPHVIPHLEDIVCIFKSNLMGVLTRIKLHMK